MAAELKIFNLIVSHLPGWHNSRHALEELRRILGHIQVFDTPHSLILLRVDNPFSAVEILRKALNPPTVILRAIPLTTVTYPYVEYVAEIVEAYARRIIPHNKSFAIKLEGYLYAKDSGKRLHKKEAINIIAENIDRRVDLSHPDFLILVKVVKVHRAQRYA